MTESDADQRPDQPVSAAGASEAAEARPAAKDTSDSASPSASTPAAVGVVEARDRDDSPPADRGGDSDTGGDPDSDTAGPAGTSRPRRRGSRGGRNRNRPRPDEVEGGDGGDDAEVSSGPAGPTGSLEDRNPELPERQQENEPSAEAADAALVRRPRIGDTRPAPASDAVGGAGTGEGSGSTARPDGDRAEDQTEGGSGSAGRRRRRRGGRGRGGSSGDASANGDAADTSIAEGAATSESATAAGGRTKREPGDPKSTEPRAARPRNQPKAEAAGQARGGRRNQGPRTAKPGRAAGPPVTAVTNDDPVDLDEAILQKRRGKERKGRPVGRYLMAVHVQPAATQISVLEGRSLIEHYVSRPSDDVAQIHGNVYLGKVQNVLPGMEAAFIDIGTPKNAVLYRGDTRYDPDDIESKGPDLRIEQILKARQTIICQVTKNPIGAKGARLTQEVSLPGRFVVLVPNSSTYGISKRLPDPERKRLRVILDKVRPEGHGLIVRTAAEGISADELERDVQRLAGQWEQIEALAAKSQAPTLLYQEPDLALRVIREEFNQDYRQVVIDDEALFQEVQGYVRSISPALVERVELYDPSAHGGLPIFENFHVHEQLHKALDRKVWLPSGGSLIIERTEALTVIDVNTGKNVGKSNLEETVYRNNLEAAEEVARQLRLRDIGGIIVIDFIDMEIRGNRDKVIATFRQALSLDKTRTQVFDISELGLVEMTRKRIGEGLLESLSEGCPTCEGRGMIFDKALIGE